MRQLEITEFFNNAAPMDYSASVAEIGANAGADTWRAACDDSSDYPLLRDDSTLEAFREFVIASSGWSESEVHGFTATELNALAIQWVAGDMRECDIGPDSSPADWAEYESRASEGIVPSRIWRNDDGRVYFSLE